MYVLNLERTIFDKTLYEVDSNAILLWDVRIYRDNHVRFVAGRQKLWP
jgi:hypothetical protein